jgi:HAD superfamily hydrolase (TIGR01509 family)
LEVLMFDLGGVLVMNDMFEELPKLTNDDLDENALKDKWLRSPAARDFELGTCSPEKFAASMVEEFQLTSTPNEFLNAFSGWPKGFYSGAEELLSNLRAQYSTACLSNSNALHWTTEVTSHFDYSYSSHLLNRIKPDVEVFDFVTSDIGREASEIAFFDDSQLNVDAAQAYGWEAHLTVGYQELTRVLRKLGVTP